MGSCRTASSFSSSSLFLLDVCCDHGGSWSSNATRLNDKPDCGEVRIEPDRAERFNMPGGDCRLDSEYRFAFGRENAPGKPVVVSRYSGGVVGSDWCPDNLPCSSTICDNSISCFCISASKSRFCSRILSNSSRFFSICFAVSDDHSLTSTRVGQQHWRKHSSSDPRTFISRACGSKLEAHEPIAIVASPSIRTVSQKASQDCQYVAEDG